MRRCPRRSRISCPGRCPHPSRRTACRLRNRRELCRWSTVNNVDQLDCSPMLRIALLFLLIGLVAGVLGFGGIAGASFAIAKIFFFVFMVLFLIFLVAGITVARRVTGG